MKGVVKRGPRERSSAGLNLWCYLFCGLIAAFSPSDSVVCLLISVLWVVALVYFFQRRFWAASLEF